MNFTPPGFESELNTIAIDFDGVIHNADKGWHDGTCYGEPISGALEALEALSAKHRLVIFTAKARADRPSVNGKTGTQLVWEWLEEHKMTRYVAKVTAEKPRASLYIDDHGYRFDTWFETLEWMEL